MSLVVNCMLFFFFFFFFFNCVDVKLFVSLLGCSVKYTLLQAPT